MARPSSPIRNEESLRMLEAGREAQIHACVYKTPVGKQAYLWERLESAPYDVQCEYVDRGGRPEESPLRHSGTPPEPLHFMVGPFNEDGSVRALSREECLAAVRSLGEAERSFTTKIGYPAPM